MMNAQTFAIFMVKVKSGGSSFAATANRKIYMNFVIMSFTIHCAFGKKTKKNQEVGINVHT